MKGWPTTVALSLALLGTAASAAPVARPLPPIPIPVTTLPATGPCRLLTVGPFGPRGEAPTWHLVYDCGRDSLLFVPLNRMWIPAQPAPAAEPTDARPMPEGHG